MWKIVIGILFIVMISAPAYAGRSSIELYEECHKLEKAPSNPKALMSDVYCAGYIDGVIDGYRITSELYPKARFICLPSTGISNDAVIKIFSKWLKNHKSEKKTPARSGVLLSLKEVYPCK